MSNFLEFGFGSRSLFGLSAGLFGLLLFVGMKTDKGGEVMTAG